MAVMFDGFEQFDKTEDLVVQIRKAGYAVDGANLTMGDGVNGRCLVMQKTSVSFDAPWSDNKMCFGLSAKFSGRGGLMSVNGNAIIADSVNGFLRFGGATGTAIPIKGKWYFYEVCLDREANTIEVLINGKSQGVGECSPSINGAQKLSIKMNAFTEKTTLEQTNTDANNTDASSRSFDNLYITDGDRFGPLTITTRFPDKSSAEEWDIHSEKEMSHAAVLGTIPSQELDRYLMTNKDAKVEKMTSSTKLPDEAGKVVGIGMVSLVRKTNREDASIVFGVGDRKQDISDLPFVWGYRYAGWRANDADTKESVEGSEMSLTSNIRSV